MHPDSSWDSSGVPLRSGRKELEVSRTGGHGLELIVLYFWCTRMPYISRPLLGRLLGPRPDCTVFHVPVFSGCT